MAYPSEIMDDTGAGAATIKRVDAVHVALPLSKPMLMAGVRIDVAQNVLVRIEASDGAVGWGEATAAPTMTGELAVGLVAAIEHLSPLLLGKDVRSHAALARNCQLAIHGNGGAKSAIDMALLDLVGRRAGVAMCDLLGGTLRETVRPMWLLGNQTIEEDLAEVSSKVKEGFTFFKLKVGVKSLEDELESARRFRRELSDDIQLCADANMGFSVARANEFIRGVRDLDLLFLEQPVRAEDLRGMQALTGLGILPICADEGIAGTAEVLSHDAIRALNGINLKLLKAGGPRAAMRVANICQALGLSITVASKIAESSISAASTLAVACSAPNIDWGVNLTHVYLAEDIVRRPLVMRDGLFACPRGPGNGVEVDDALVERYKVA